MIVQIWMISKVCRNETTL